MNNVIKKIGVPLAMAGMTTGIAKPGAVAEAKIQESFGDKTPQTKTTLVKDAKRGVAEGISKPEGVQGKQGIDGEALSRDILNAARKAFAGRTYALPHARDIDCPGDLNTPSFTGESGLEMTSYKKANGIPNSVNIEIIVHDDCDIFGTISTVMSTDITSRVPAIATFSGAFEGQDNDAFEVGNAIQRAARGY